MGVFKWLRRERVTVTTRHVSPEQRTQEDCPQNVTQIGTIRTEEYKRDLAEFQARRSTGSKEFKVTPVKKKCGRHSLPVSCTDCSVDRDNSFKYDKKSAAKYKKKTQRRVRSATSDEKTNDAVPNIQFLFQNQVFMPGNLLTTSAHSEPPKFKRVPRHMHRVRSPDSSFITQRHIDFKDEDSVDSPEFFKNNSLPFDVKNFLGGSKSDEDVDGAKHEGSVKVSSYCSPNGVNKDDSGEEKLWQVMSELKSFDRWADEQLLQSRSSNTKSDDNKSETSAYGLAIASTSNVDVTSDTDKVWSHGKWGSVPVQIKRLPAVTMEHVRKKRNMEINILRKCRHPSIILLMGLYPDIHNNVNMVCERCVDTLYGILHEQGRILTVQMSVQYALDIANALVFLRMQGFIHSELSSESIMLTGHNAAKLADLSPCLRMPKDKPLPDKGYEVYSPEPQYINIEDSRQSNGDCEPLLSRRSSEAYLTSSAVSKDYEALRRSPRYRWLAPELYQPDDGLVRACSKTDVYSLTLILWECCNAAVPWKTLSYDKLKELYVMWNTGIRLPQDGTYPGSLLALLQNGLKLQRRERIDLNTMQDTLQNVKRNIDRMDYIVIPARISDKKSQFSSVWDTSPTDSERLSPLEVNHKAVVHNERESSSESSEREGTKSDSSALYEVVNKPQIDVTYATPDKCRDSKDQVDEMPKLKYDLISTKGFSSACSTPIAKLKARIKDIGTPGNLHRSDSTEYCSILSPNRTTNLALNEDLAKDQTNIERPTAKLSRSFTPQSYRPLHIKVPECNLDSIKTILKEQNGFERSSYKFDIKNYSLPSTPIARSNKLRKNAWLSGDLSFSKRSMEVLPAERKSDNGDYGSETVASQSNTPVISSNASPEKDQNFETESDQQSEVKSPTSVETHDCFSTLRRVNPPQVVSSPDDDAIRERSSSWSFKTPADRTNKYRVEDEILANINVKPLVAIHERWIYEANKKTERSMSLPDSNRSAIPAVKPASHCVDTLQKSLPQLNVKKAKGFRAPGSPSLGKNGGAWEQFCQTRDTIARSMNLTSRDSDHSAKDVTEDQKKCETKSDRATDTGGIEDVVRDLIRKEFDQLLREVADEARIDEDTVSRGVSNVVESLNGEERREPIRSFSKVKIIGNNKPLVHITFGAGGQRALHVLDSGVTVTVCDQNSPSVDPETPTSTEDDGLTSLKRCQTFSAIQEARSTEDLYIDDDLSTHMQENFGGRVKLIPLRGSAHEARCRRAGGCCLRRVSADLGIDLDLDFDPDLAADPDADQVDGHDTLLVKRSISVVEEHFRRIPHKDRAPKPAETKPRPKSEVFPPSGPINVETRMLSTSSPSLTTKDEVQVNIEDVMCYQDSSEEDSPDQDDFEFLERKIEADLANASISTTCGCLEKISEENLSVINEEVTDRE